MSKLARRTAEPGPVTTQAGACVGAPASRRRQALIAAGAVVAATVMAMGSPAAGTAAAASPCPALMVLGVAGTGESSPTASPTADTGMLGRMFAPMLAMAHGTVDRRYVAYPAGFGGAVPGGAVPYATSERAASVGLWRLAAQTTARCPATMLAAAGYSQGAQVVADFARAVGEGRGAVPASRVAGVALFADPTSPGGGVLPGMPDRSTPLPAPGTDGHAVSTVRLPVGPDYGTGIGTDPDGFGALVGRVAELCVPGDLACAAPTHAALLRTVAAVVAQGDYRDPIAAVDSLREAWALVAARAWIAVLSHDVTDGPVPQYRPQQTLSQRIADAASPWLPAPPPQDVVRAHLVWTRVAAAVAADPMGELGGLTAQLGAALPGEIAANRDLLDFATWSRYRDVIDRHRSYATCDDGTSPTDAAARWFAALGRDIART